MAKARIEISRNQSDCEIHAAVQNGQNCVENNSHRRRRQGDAMQSDGRDQFSRLDWTRVRWLDEVLRRFYCVWDSQPGERNLIQRDIKLFLGKIFIWASEINYGFSRE